jgi:hypothetical protein
MNKREIKRNQMYQINQTNQSSDNNPVIARSAATKQSLTINAFLVRDCFKLPVVRIVKALRIPALAMTARRRDAMTISTNMSSPTGFLFADNYNANINTNAAAAHFQLSTFNFQLITNPFHAYMLL